MNQFPKLHNAMWPGLVGKGPDAEEPAIGLETMLNLTAQAEVDGTKFDGVDLFLYDPHVSIDISEDGLKRLVDQIAGYGLSVGSVVAPIWFEGNAMGNDVQVQGFLTAVRKACQIAARLRDMGIRKYGVVRIDSACGPADWQQNPLDNQKRIAETFRKAGEIAQDFDERLAAEGEICWGGMHSWRDMVNLLELVDMRDTVGFQADLAHTYLYLLGYNAAEHRLLPENYSDEQFWQAYETLTQALRPWTIDFHVAQNDGTVKGSGSHDKTGRHCPATDPNGKLDIVKCSGYWLQGAAERGIQHLCWDGCMFPNAVLENKQTYNDILRVMMQVRDQHGW
ncbi:MAG TPA: TIM barrel protein [Pirellulaceae bacterium]|nr:TIM barrel protein [Pirellulaceae bacterium]HMP69735.1 TIM barrel protein [Pirellulaceae bacterium]